MSLAELSVGLRLDVAEKSEFGQQAKEPIFVRLKTSLPLKIREISQLSLAKTFLRRVNILKNGWEGRGASSFCVF
ncbi:hypothetical protein [Rhizobium vallis]|uniref:hypothetical protein n=1 Tax=Rhizobium vallis TaxID=634290 RepID=UPI000F863104|nr:hypothetical protein [Rhizobium vallis]